MLSEMATERGGYTAGGAVTGAGGVIVVIAVTTASKGSDIAHDGLFWFGVGVAAIGFLIVLITGGKHLFDLVTDSLRGTPEHSDLSVKIRRVAGYLPEEEPLLVKPPGWLSTLDPLTPLDTPLVVDADPQPVAAVEHINMMYWASASEEEGSIVIRLGCRPTLNQSPISVRCEVLPPADSSGVSARRAALTELTNGDASVRFPDDFSTGLTLGLLRPGVYNFRWLDVDGAFNFVWEPLPSGQFHWGITGS
jgi:hypothetical protein